MLLHQTDVARLVPSGFRPNNIQNSHLLISRPTLHVRNEREHERPIRESAPLIFPETFDSKAERVSDPFKRRATKFRGIAVEFLSHATLRCKPKISHMKIIPLASGRWQQCE